MDTWFENESFWREGYRFMFSDDAFRAATDQVEQVIVRTGISVGRVLDLGCGPGRHTVPLALKGFHVTAVDASPFLLGKAQDSVTCCATWGLPMSCSTETWTDGHTGPVQGDSSRWRERPDSRLTVVTRAC
jgi:hypothetical protein